MCGLFGLVGSGITHQDLTVLQDLAIMSTVRGYEGTGFALGAVHKPQRVHIIKKEKSDPLWFYRTLSKDDAKEMDNPCWDFFLGHCRKPTEGDEHGVQPFDFSEITGTHNGTVEINQEGFHSDSQALYSKINDLGIHATLKTLKDNDSYSLVWWDKKTRTVNFLRNSKRPLWFCLNDTRTVLYYASELGILRAALERRDIKLLANTHYYPQPGVLYQFEPRVLKNKGEMVFRSEVLSSKEEGIVEDV